MLPTLVREGLVDAVDAFCETIGFTPAQTERVFRAAAALGVPVKLHAEQWSDQGGAALTARYRGLSADHLEHLTDDGIAAMAQAGTVAVLLPGAFYCLRETKLPPIEALRAARVPMAVATDRKLAIQQLNTAISESNKLMAILTDNFNKSENRRLEAATALIDFAIKQVQLIIAKINAQIEYNKGMVQMFAAEAEAYRAVAEAEAAIIRANVDYALGKIKVFIGKLNAKLDFFKAKYGLEIEGYKTILSSATQLTASAWGAVGITASLQASSNEQRQSSISVSEQWSHSETLSNR